MQTQYGKVQFGEPFVRLKFRIGDAFPPDDRIAQFLTGLCLVVNDVTLVMRHMDRIYETPEGMSRINTYYLYLVCAYYREAANYLHENLADPVVATFLDRLSEEATAHLDLVKQSFTPWETSFVREKLKPIRDVVFHYRPWTASQIAPYLAAAADDYSVMEFGTGTYLETRYEFADAVFEEFVHGVWGKSEAELKAVLEEMVRLVIALTHFAHEAITAYVQQLGLHRFTVEG